MLKLRYLYDNRDLALMLLKNWEFDESSLGLMNQFRISANAIYPFNIRNELHFLRFAPISEKADQDVQAEIDFLKFLVRKHYHSLVPVASKHGEELAVQETPWGKYCAAAFKSVKGESLGSIDVTNEIAFLFGQQLGELHRLSSEYQPGDRVRWTHDDVFRWIEHNLKSLDHEQHALHELSLLRDYFTRIPQSTMNYGLIHFDFELDNVFYDDISESCYVIDFDDAMYHWYVMDIEQTLDSIKTELPQNNFSMLSTQFLRGYKTVFPIDDEDFKRMPAFRRFANLYGYTRIRRAVEEKWPNETGWIVNLRHILDTLMEERQKMFGTSIQLD